MDDLVRWRCEVTNNPVGTDTRMIGAPECECRGCRGWEMERLATAFLCAEIDYMTINNLGDPEQKHNVKWARQLGIKVFELLPA
jgi:hypothetical protein